MSIRKPAGAFPGGGKIPPSETLSIGALQDFQDFCELLERACGIKLGEEKGYLVSSRLATIQREQGCRDLGELVKQLSRPGSATRDLRTRVVDAMTTNETLWFRDDYPFKCFDNTVLPACQSVGHRVRVWSAACSTGQEPYSVSMCVEEYKRRHPGALRAEVEIVGTDISRTALKTARDAVYAEHALRRGLSDERRRSFFEDTRGGCRPRAEIRARVGFRDLNLLDSYALLGRFDVIFCRNVLIYFSRDRRADILGRMVGVLKPGGWLFLGGSESVPSSVHGLTLQRDAHSVVYRRD